MSIWVVLHYSEGGNEAHYAKVFCSANAGSRTRVLLRASGALRDKFQDKFWDSTGDFKLYYTPVPLFLKCQYLCQFSIFWNSTYQKPYLKFFKDQISQYFSLSKVYQLIRKWHSSSLIVILFYIGKLLAARSGELFTFSYSFVYHVIKNIFPWLECWSKIKWNCRLKIQNWFSH